MSIRTIRRTWRVAKVLSHGYTLTSYDARRASYSSSHLQANLRYPLIQQLKAHFQARQISTIENNPSSTKTSRSKFTYNKLNDGQSHDKNAIRLLELLHGHDGDKLQCRLRHVTLATAPGYETISYRWGDLNDREMIECNDASLSIPAALATALRNIRYHDRPRLIWADAVCIDQSDLREKEQQVKLMRDIYSQSQRTLIWLGDQPNIKVSWTARIPILFSLGWFRRMVKDCDIPKMRFDDYRDGKRRAVSPLSTEGYIAFVNILRNGWFQRAWVVQEVAVSRNPTVIWNGYEVPWKDLVRSLEFLSHMDFGLAFIPTLQHIASIESERQRYQDDTMSSELLGILQRHQRCEATDDRDKVFAFVGLTTALPSAFEIDYAKSADEIYKTVSRDILLSEKSLRLLSQPASLGPRSSSLPSWVPDWSRVKVVEMSHSWGLEALSLARKVPFPGDESCLKFSAAPEKTNFPTIMSDGLGLPVEGHVFDTITEIGDVFEGIELPPPVTGIRGIIKGWVSTCHTYTKAQLVLMGWEALAGARTPDKFYLPTGETMIDAYWKTVSAGDYPHTPGVRFEVKNWNRVNTLAWRLRKYKIRRFVLPPYASLLSIWQAVSKGPAFKFHIQGHYTLFRRFARTEKGFLALVGSDAKKRDCVVLAKGSNVPLVLRKTENEDRWTLVGDAYVHGIMFREGWDESTCETLILQ
jgi:hypothetical protein